MSIRKAIRFISDTASDERSVCVRMNEKKIFLLLNKHVAAETHGVPRDAQDDPTQEPTLDNETRIKERNTLNYNRMLEKFGHTFRHRNG